MVPPVLKEMFILLRMKNYAFYKLKPLLHECKNGVLPEVSKHAFDVI